MRALLEVGRRLDPDLRRPEGATLTLVTGAPAELMIVLGRPHELEIQAVSAAPARFAWIDAGPAALLLYRLGPVLPWAQVTYSPHLGDPADGPAGLDADAFVRLVLVDRDTDVVRALHMVRWPDAFAAAVRTSVAAMRAQPFDRLAYDHALAGLHRVYPTTEDLLIDRVEVDCTAPPA